MKRRARARACIGAQFLVVGLLGLAQCGLGADELSPRAVGAAPQTPAAPSPSGVLARPAAPAASPPALSESPRRTPDSRTADLDSLIGSALGEGSPARAPGARRENAPVDATGNALRSLGYAGGGVSVPRPSAPTASFAGRHGGGPAADLPAIDPNGRFATTYRPGGGHLAWFEAQMSRGGIPAGARDLVGDLGSHYSPEIAVPARQALAYQVDLERSALPPSGGHTHLRIALRSRAGAPARRPPLSVHVVLDVSGSMQGDPIVQAKQAVVSLVERLDARDRFSLTTFSSGARVLVADGLVGARRRVILDQVASIEAQGGTNISAGLDLGYGESRRGPSSPEWVRIVMLLSDGRPNAGVSSAEGLGGRAALAFQDGIQTSAFGIGSGFDPAVMSAVAESGAGGYYYLRDGSSIAPALGAELDSRLQPVAQAVEIRVRLRDDIRLTQAYGSRRLGEREAGAVRAQETAVDRQVAARDRIAEDRQEDLEGGMRFFIPGFSPDDRHVILLGIDVPGGLGERPIATVELRYKDRVARRNAIEETPVRVRFASSDAESVATRDASVARSVQGFDAGESLLSAARMIDRGNRDAAVAILAERAELLRQAASTLGESRFRQDAGRLDRFRSLVGGGGELSQPLVLALLLETSGKGLLH